MQTFLPYPDGALSASVLDNKRLGKQRVEAWQILRTLRGETLGWRRHPAVRMWIGYQDWLRAYGRAVCVEWRRRGFRDSLLERFTPSAEQINRAFLRDSLVPPWWGNDEFHASHRSNLLRKDPQWYGRFGWAEPPELAYVWPA